eukprot:2539506-Heterocapsa_arctica.AAC.1
MMKKKAFNLCASVAVNKFVHVDDILIPVDRENMAYASAFELFLGYGNDHYSKVFDKLTERLNTNRTVQDYTMLGEINCTTKANIIQSILGLGH